MECANKSQWAQVDHSHIGMEGNRVLTTWHIQGKGAIQETAHIFLGASKLQKALQFYRYSDMKNKTGEKKSKELWPYLLQWKDAIFTMHYFLAVQNESIS